MTDYSIYNTLDNTEPHFRLVKILPASTQEEPIQCCLLTIKVEDAPEYEALSYCWGDASDVEAITVSQKPFLATKNLAKALRNLRYEDRDRIMWIDAICICQTDNVEKNHQIPLMTRIYGDAASVIVWLGAGEEAADVIRSLYHEDLHWDSRNHPPLKWHLLKVIMSLRDIYASPWWKRVWTIQEMMLARVLKFHCNHDVVLTEEEVFGMPTKYLRHKSLCCKDWNTAEGTGIPGATFVDTVERFVEPIRTLSHFRRHTQERGHCLPLELLAAQFRYRNATNPRDKLYGLLGMCRYSGRSPPIDYNRPISDCYKAMASWMICESRTLHVLNMTSTLPHQEYDHTRDDQFEPVTDHLPSWCPNWHVSPNKKKLPSTEVRKFDFLFYEASGPGWETNLLFEKHVSAQGNLEIPDTSSTRIILEIPAETDDFWRSSDDITLQGLEFDTIKAVDMMPELYGSGKFSTSLPLWRTLAESTLTTGVLKDSMYPSGQCDAEEAFIRTICADVVARRTTEDSTIFPAIPIFFSEVENKSTTAEWIANFWAAANSMKPGDINNDLFTHHIGPIASSIQAATINRRFFVTEKGYFGLGPATTQPGDLVWILMGGTTPYILRQIDDPDNAWPHDNWTFLGDAYVHGIMRGEAVKESQGRGWSIPLKCVYLR